MRELDRQERYALWLYLELGADPHRYARVTRELGDAAAAFEAAAAGDIALIPKDRANEQNIDDALETMQKYNMAPVTLESGDYPALLKEISVPPPVLFVKGRLKSELFLPIAVIGSRRATEYGARAAKLLSGELAQRGVCIVSGMAMGIDGIAARTALEQGTGECPTVAVLGCGADVPYPVENIRLYAEIAERGAIISEFPPGTLPLRHNFPRRNRVISGLSRGVLVIEAAEKSGTSITVNFALEQGRDVFAVPGRITDVQSAGTNRLIAEGCAKPVITAEDIFSEYGIKASRKSVPNREAVSLCGDEQKLIYGLLMTGEKSFDELLVLSGLGIPALNSALTAMEFSGIINQSSGRVYGI